MTTKAPVSDIPFFRKNFDYGEGPYSHMNELKTITDKVKKRKKRMRKRKAQMVEIWLKLAETDKDETEANMSIPFAPAEPAPIGMLDGVYPKEDLEDKPVTNPYYGIMETHNFADDAEKDKLTDDKKKTKTTKDKK